MCDNYTKWTKDALVAECKKRQLDWNGRSKADLISSLTQSEMEPASKRSKVADAKGDGDLDDIDCPVCMCNMLPPIYLCSVGHSICARCFGKLKGKPCPTCAKPFAVPAARNFFLEAMIEKRVVKCPHGECTFKGRYCDAQTQAHIKEECQHRPVLCLMCAQFDGSPLQVAEHLKDFHALEKIELRSNEPHHFKWVLPGEDHLYHDDLLRCFVVVLDKKWPYLVELERTAAWFFVHVTALFRHTRTGTVTIQSLPIFKRKFQFEGPVRRYDKGPHQKDGLCIPRSVVDDPKCPTRHFECSLTLCRS